MSSRRSSPRTFTAAGVAQTHSADIKSQINDHLAGTALNAPPNPATRSIVPSPFIAAQRVMTDLKRRKWLIDYYKALGQAFRMEDSILSRSFESGFVGSTDRLASVHSRVYPSRLCGHLSGRA